MPLPEFDYMRPLTVDELSAILAKHKGEARLMAGGTDLIPLMRESVLRPKYVVDVKGVKELHGITTHDGGVTIGAAVTVNEIVESEIIRKKFTALWSAAKELSDQTLRSRATLAGNICNASPAADSCPSLLVLGAEVEVVGAHGKRKIPIAEFFKGVKRTALAQDEFVKAVHIPNQPAGAKSLYSKWKRSWGEDVALVGVAALVSGKKVRVAMSSVAPTPVLVPEIGNVFYGEGTLEEKIEKAAACVPGGICPINDVRCQAEYRTHMAAVLTKRVLRELLGVKK